MDNKHLEKIKKLVALAASPVPAEAALAMEKANELMEKHNIRFCDVHLGDGKVQCNVNHGEAGSMKGALEWEERLAAGISSALDCVAILSKDNAGNNKYIFAGSPIEVELVTDIFKRVRRIISKMSIQYTTGMDGRKARKARRHYSHGIVDTVGNRMKEIYKPAGESLALVVAKKEATSEYLKDMLGDYGSKNTKHDIKDRDAFVAYMRGQQDGETVAIHKSIKA